MITITNCRDYKKFNFPVGEVQVFTDPIPERIVDIGFEYERNEEIIELLMFCDSIKRANGKLGTLYMSYVPFSRQDRVTKPGESFTLKVFCDLINTLNFKRVSIKDPHSDVTTALLNNCEVIEQWRIFVDYFFSKKDGYPYGMPSKDYWLISPDGGALKKIYKLADKIKPLGVVLCSKRRNTDTGEITGINVDAKDLMGKDCYIVDDICDGGRTFIEIARKLKDLNPGKIILMVTHGFFTKGLDLFDELIDAIYTSKGKIK